MNKTIEQGHGRGRFFEILKAYIGDGRLEIEQAEKAKKETEKVKNTEGKLETEPKESVPELKVDKDNVDNADPSASPTAFNRSMDLLASNLRERDLNLLPTVLMCRDPIEAKKFKMEMEKRNVKKVLGVFDYSTVESVMPLWPEGFVQKLLIISENLMPQMHNKKIDLLILNEIPAEDYIHRVNRGCEILCLKDHRIIHQNKNISLPIPNSMCPLNGKIQRNSEEVHSPLKEDLFRMGRHYSNFGVIAWSCYPIISCYYNMGVPYLSNAIRMSMKNMEPPHDRARNVQRYAWPHLASGYSMIMIGHEKCGKSWSYIPTICQSIYDATLKEGDLDWTGPKCILVAANYEDGRNLNKALLNILSFCSTDKMELIVTLWDNNFLGDVVKNLSRPTGILLTTADLLLQLHQMETVRCPIFHPGTVRCLVLDNLGDMYRHHPIKAPLLMKWLISTFHFESQTQLIITGRLWIEKLMRCQLIPMLSDILLVIEDGLEAAAYGGIKLNVKFVSDCDYREGHSLLKVLSGRNLKGECIVIVCFKDGDCLKMCKMLKAYDVDHFYYGLKSDAQNQHIQSYQGIIVTLDDMLPRLKCGPVDLLINYTLTHTWHRFKQRFNLFHANYKTQIKPHGEALVFLNPLVAEEGWLFSDFMLKHDMDMPQEWLDHLNDFRLQKEILMPRLNSNLCMQLVAYGNCYRRTCRYRHVMRCDEVKPGNHLPKHQGELSFRILYCNSPANLSVRLVECTNSLSVVEKIQDFYANEANRIQVVNPSVGDICITEHDNLYERVIITAIDLPIVKVRQLDWGTENFNKNIEKLIGCDKRFRYEKFQAMDMRLTGIMPHSMDRIWTDDVKRLIRYKFFNNVMGRPFLRDSIYTATIDFVFHNTIFVENIFNDKGKDLRTFIKDNLKVYDDKLVKGRLLKISTEAQKSSDSKNT